MIVNQFFIKGIAHSSYLLGASGSCAIVDPRRDVGIYIEAAQELGLQIRYILETHLHADFISGHLDLMEMTGARIYAPKAGGCKFDHVPVSENDTIEIENVVIRVIETPGHTPEHVSYVVTDTARGNDPAGVFCGDTLFVGDVGRPDLFPGIAKDLARQLYHSLHDKLMKLPDFCEVYPAHGAGSLCGRAMGAKRVSTIGYERRNNGALQVRDIDEFVNSLTSGMPPAPDHFSRCSAVNGRGPDPLRSLPVLETLKPEQFRQKMSEDGTIVLDTRKYESYGGQHIPDSYHVDFGGNFATFAAWIIPPGSKILLVAESPEQARQAAVWLQRVGLDSVTGYLDGGMYEWAKRGYAMKSTPQISSAELNEMIRRGEEISLVDVRSPGEYDAHHISGSISIPAPAIRTRYSELNRDVLNVLICGTGHRSSTAISLLEQRGFGKLANAAGGMTGYSAAGFSPECPLCIVPHGPKFNGSNSPWDNR